jgi:DNA-binding NarL/FixJ family response regulator
VERAGLVALLADLASVTVVHATERVHDVDAIVTAHDVDVILLAIRVANDLLLPLEVTADLAHRVPALVVLVDDAPVPWVISALANGVHAILPRDATADELQAAVVAARARLLTVTREHFEALGAAARVRRPMPPATAEPLTPREAEILGLLADGLANKEIAAQLRISAHTVKTHVQSLFAKLGADSRAEAVALGVRKGLILL